MLFDRLACLLPVFIIFLLPTGSESSRVLFAAPLVSKSHHLFNKVLADELARRGHHVTYLTPYTDKVIPANMTHIVMEGVIEKVAEGVDLIDMVNSLSPRMMLKDLNDYSSLTCELHFNTKGFTQFVQTARKDDYDLIIVDYGINDCFIALVDLFPNTPVVGITAFAGALTPNSLTGNPESLAVKPLLMTMHYGKMNFLQRVYNLLVYLYIHVDRHYFQLHLEDKIARTKFPHMTDIHQLLQKYELVLLNDHYSMNPPVPTVPGLVYIGGIHILPPKPLPNDVKKFIDDSPQGVIFFSLGTNILSKDLGEDKLKIILQVLKELSPVRVLWKFETDKLGNKPDNVMIKQWLPQNDILAHPNVKLFITHSGLLSTLETVHHGVPIVGLPFLMDQWINIGKCMSDGFAEKWDYNNFNKQEMLNTVRKVLNEPKYKENAMKLSRIFRDQPDTPLNRAVFWVEHVIRHKGARHLRSPSLELTWYQNQMLDVAAFLAVSVLLILHVVYSVVRRLVLLTGAGSSRHKLKRN